MDYVYKYNPSVKPVHYKPGVPVMYIGLPPDAGFSYSSLDCESCENAFVATGEHHNFCPSCGAKTLATSSQEVNSDSQKEVTCSIEHTCNKCGTHQVVGTSEFGENVHCVGCGSKQNIKDLVDNTLKEKKAMSQDQTTVALLKIIADLKEQGNEELANELEKQVPKEEENEQIATNPNAKVASLDSGVNQIIPTGNREEDAKKMIEEEQKNPTPVQSEEDELIIKAVAQAETLAKFGIPSVIKPLTYEVVASDEYTEEEQVQEETATEEVIEDQPHIVDQATAELILAYNKRNGISTRVTRVESGYVLASLEEEVEENAETLTDEQIKDVVDPTTLPEEEATDDETVKVQAVKYEETANDEEPEVLSEEEAYQAIAAIHATGKNARAVRVVEGYVVTAEDVSEDEIQEEVEEIQEETANDQKEMLEKVSTVEDVKEEMKAFDNIEKEMLADAEEEFKDQEDKIEDLACGEDMQIKAELPLEEETASEDDKIEEELKEQQDETNAEEDEEVVLDMATAQVILAYNKRNGISTRVTRVESGYVLANVVDEEKVEETETVKEENAAEEINHPEVTFATLTDVDSLVVSSEEDVTMILSEVENNPFYTVLVQGEPVARIELNAQPKPQEIAEYFPTEDYAMAMVDAMKKLGVKQTLASVNAKFYANEIVPSNASEKLTASIKDGLDKQYAESVASMVDDFADRIALEVTAFNKNFYKNEDNLLKAALYNTILDSYNKNNGRLSEEAIVAALETGFENGAAPYFGKILDKAVARMGQSKEAFAEAKRLIGEADIQSLEYEEEEANVDELEEQQTYASHLASNSVTASLSEDFTNEVIRQKLHFRKY